MLHSPVSNGYNSCVHSQLPCTDRAAAFEDRCTHKIDPFSITTGVLLDIAIYDAYTTAALPPAQKPKRIRIRAIHIEHMWAIHIASNCIVRTMLMVIL